MSDKVLIPLAGIGTLALDREAFEAALAEGAGITAPPPSAGSDEPLMDSEQLAAVLHIPQTWLEQAAREQRIPSIQAGRWRRFRRSAVEQALSRSGNNT